MKKRGFTLIELLAVIVILAIIALIAVPAVLNIIEDSRKGAAEASARNIVSSAKTYYMSETMNGRTVESIDLSGTTLKYDGNQATKGSITFTDGKPVAKMYISGYCVEVSANGSITSEKIEETDCEIESAPIVPEPIEPTQKLVFPVVNGQEVYFNPNTGLACGKNQVLTNVNNYREGNSNSITDLKEGCMKWYAFLDSTDSNTVNLILDHNTTDYVAWSNSGETTPTLANAQLQTDITNWTGEAKSSARLISAEEVNRIAPTAEGYTWSVSDYNMYYHFHTGTNTVYNTGTSGSNTYAWLFDNTNRCTTYGCNVADSGTYGYWTSSFASSGNAWYVGNDGSLRYFEVDRDGNFGVRPVITISKSVFE